MSPQTFQSKSCCGVCARRLGVLVLLFVSRRLEIELTSDRTDGQWTWRAAGAKKPKGLVDAKLLPEKVQVGDVLRVEANASLDGLEIITVLPSRLSKPKDKILQLIGSAPEESLVMSTTATKTRSKNSKGSKKERSERPQNSNAEVVQNKKKRNKRAQDDRSKQVDKLKKRNNNQKRRSSLTKTSKTRRLRPNNKHRLAALEALPKIQQELASEVMRRGVAGVRESIERMNALAKDEGIPQVKSEPLVALAEQLAPIMKAAEWRDRAEAVYANLETVDLKDLRTVVVAADSAARDEESKALAKKIQEGLTTRVEREHRAWLNEIVNHLTDGRTVLALTRSSRPPKAGAPLPIDVSERLTKAAVASLTSDTAAKRWATVLEALAYSPVRSLVTPQSCIEKPSEELLATIKRLSPKIPQIASLFGIEDKSKSLASVKVRPQPPPPPQQTSQS